MRWRLAFACLIAACFGETLAAADSPRHASKPGVRWQLALPGWGEPAADDAAAYFLTRTHELVAVDPTSGAIRWRRDTGGPGDVPTGTRVRLTASLVLVGDGGIVAFDRASGRQAWRFDAPDGDDAGVFLGTVDTGLVVAGSPAGRIYAVDVASGTLRWQHAVVVGERRSVFPPVHAGRSIVASFTRFDGPLSGGLLALDRAGRRRWIHRFEDGVGAAGPPVVAGDAVVVARTDGCIEAIGVASGRRLWSLTPEAATSGIADGRDIRALASHAGIVAVTSLRGPVRAFDLHDRRQRWTYAGGPADAVALRVRLHGDRLYVPYSDGSLVALDLRTGRECWRADRRLDAFDWPPAAIDAAVFASAQDALWSLDAARDETATLEPETHHH